MMKTNLLKEKLITAIVISCVASVCFAADTEFTSKIRSIASNIAESVSDSQKKVVAVVDFTDLEGNVNTLGRFLAEEMTVAVAQEGKGLNIVDRLQLRRMLAEKNISGKGIIDPAFAKQIGQISGAEAIITGVAYPVSDSVYLSVKLIDIKSARIYAAGSLLLSRSPILDDLIKASIKLQEEESTVKPAKKVFSPQARQADVLVFVLKEVSFENNVLVLNLNIRNTSDEPRYLTIDSVRALDNNGRECFPSFLAAGGTRAVIGEKGKIQSTNGREISDNFDVHLRQNQEISAQVSFRNISSKANAISFLEMTVAPVNIIDSHGTFMRIEDDPLTIQFTNIDIPDPKNASR